MHDFIQNLSFNSQSPFPATRPGEALSSLTRSFNEAPASYRPSPRNVGRVPSLVTRAKSRGVGAPRPQLRTPKSAPLTNNS
jgi:hypothetical protein